MYTGEQKITETKSDAFRQETVGLNKTGGRWGNDNWAQSGYTQKVDMTGFEIAWKVKVRKRHQHRSSPRCLTRAIYIYFIHLLLYLAETKCCMLLNREKLYNGFILLCIFIRKGYCIFLHYKENKKRDLVWEEWNNGKWIFKSLSQIPLQNRRDFFSAQKNIWTHYYSW